MPTTIQIQPQTATKSKSNGVAGGDAHNQAHRICRELSDRIGAHRYGMWFAGASVKVDGQLLEIATDSPFVAKWIDRHFAQELRGVAQRNLGEDVEVKVHVADPALAKSSNGNGNGNGHHAHNGAANGEATAARGRSDHSRKRSHGAAADDVHAELLDGERPTKLTRRPAPLRRLSEFVVGDCNRLAHAAACRLVENVAAKCISPLFIHGECGVGKTHLLQGACQRYVELTGRKQHVRYVHCEQFTNDYITAIRSHKIDEFRQKMRKLDLLAIDDVHFLSNKLRTQTEFLYTLDAIDLSGARIVMASDNHPHHIKSFNQALVSRFVSGMVVKVDRPDRTTRLELVQRLARERGLRINSAAAECIADHCVGSVRELEGAITKLTAYGMMVNGNHSTSNGRISPTDADGAGEIGLVLAEQLFKDQRRPASSIVRMQTIFDVVCARLGVNKSELMSSGRHRRVVLARSLLAYLARELTTHSFPEIAQSLGRSNHSTVHTADQRLRKQIAAMQSAELGGGEAPINLRELVENLRRDIIKASSNA